MNYKKERTFLCCCFSKNFDVQANHYQNSSISARIQQYVQADELIQLKNQSHTTVYQLDHSIVPAR